MKRFTGYFKSHKKYYILAPLFMMLEAAGEFILPFMNADVIDVGIATGDRGYIFRQTGLMLVLALFMMIMGLLGALCSIRAASRTAGDIRRDTFGRIQTFSFSELDRFSSGSLITRITNDVTQIQDFLQVLLRGCFRSPVMLIGAVVMSFVLAPDLGWILLGCIPVLVAALVVLIKAAIPRYAEMQRRIDTLNTGIAESIRNARVIKSFVREDYERDKFNDINDALMVRSERALAVMIYLQPLVTVIINVTTVLIVGVAGHSIMFGKMEIGTLTAFVTYLVQVQAALNILANAFLKGTRAVTSDKRIEEVLSTVSSVCEPEGETETPADGSIAFENVSFRYYKNDATPVLDGISFTVAGGERVGILGPTGSGKTTLISMIPRLYDPDNGTVRLGGADVKRVPLNTLRDGVAVVLQKNTLFSGTVAENLRWGNPDATDEQLRSAAHIAAADEFIDTLPNGYDTMIERGGANLSGGQRQRLCIARALVKNAPVLIMDDSLSAVDTATDARIRKELREKLPGVTQLIIAQRVDSVLDADRIIVLDHGKIAGCGKHDGLMASCPTYREIYESQKDKSAEDTGSSCGEEVNVRA